MAWTLTIYFFLCDKWTSSPYINHFLQPDTLIPDPSNPQAWNRFAYVLNNPINAADPSGHKCVGDPEECKDDNGKIINGSGGFSGDGNNEDDDEIASSIKIGFGIQTDAGWGATQGLGTVVNNQRSILTAYHIYGDAVDPTHMFIWSNVNDYEMTTIPLDQVKIIQNGDLAIVYIPNDLPGSYKPATISDLAADQYLNLPSGAGLSVIYIGNDNNKANPEVLDVNYLGQTSHRGIISNPNRTTNKGDSGGGIFYNGKLIGVMAQGDGAPISQFRSIAPTFYEWLTDSGFK